MFSNTGYLYDIELNITYENIENIEEFIVYSCGNYELIDLESMEVLRPLGRSDWQIIYVAEGKAHFNIEGKELVMNAGNIIIFRPLEPQIYYYLLADNPNIFWIHFTGEETDKLFQVLGLTEKIYPVGINHNYQEIFNKIIKELQLKRSGFQTICNAYAKELFVRMSRETYNIETMGMNPEPFIKDVIETMYQNYQKQISIEEYAEKNHISTGWFIRKFKAHTGKTPQQFLIRIRIGKAYELLENTALNISEIAALVGYDNPLYFSRLFKKVTGVPPKVIRNRKQNNIDLENEKEIGEKR